MTKVMEIEGVGPAFAEKLAAAGIESVEKLLEEGATPAGRLALEKKTGVQGAALLAWLNRADLMRVKGIGHEYSDLIEASGVDTVKELAHRRPENLLAKMEEVNAAKKLVRRLPTLAEVEKWVAEAKALPSVLTY